MPLRAEFVFVPQSVSLSGETAVAYARPLFDTRGEVAEASKGLNNNFTLATGGRGYIWRPWFSDLSADANLNWRHSSAWGGGESSIAWDGRVSARLDLVPRSHVPFQSEFAYTRNDGGDQVWLLTLNQGLETLRKDLPDFKFYYGLQRQEGERSATLNHQFNMSMDGRHGGHNYNGVFNVLDLHSDSESAAAQTTTLNASGQHSKEWSSVLTSTGFASAYDSKTRSQNNGGESGIDSSGQRVSTVWNWSPSRAMGVVAGLSVSRDRSVALGAGGSDYKSFAVNASATRSIGAAHRLVGSASADRAWGRDEDEGRSAEVGYYWFPSPVLLMGLDYRRDFSVRAGWLESNGAGQSFQRVDASHGLNDGVPLLGGHATWSFIQSIGFQSNSGEERGILDHRAGLRWSGGDQGVDDSLSLTLSDRRDERGDSTQAVDFVALRRGRLGDFSLWDITLDYQWSRDSEDGVVVLQDYASAQGMLSMAYERGNMFGVFNLYYSSQLSLDLGRELGISAFERRSSWNNGLYYGLGRLLVQLSLDIYEDNAGGFGELRLDISRRWSSRW